MESEIENIFENRKEFMIHLLEFLNDKPKGVELGEFFFSIMPSHGMENFQEILVEMKKQKWINILESPSVANVGGLRIPTKDVKYTIAIGGIEYLDKLKIIVDKFKVVDKRNEINIVGNVIGSNIIQDSSDLENILSKQAKAKKPVAKPTKNKDQGFWEKAKSVSVILGFVAALIGLITKLMDVW
ncbi:hypothetical protein HNP99_002122 [Flavobacterium sp. 28A]|uniref:hypothetical protein n=1 Tax=Flavobacterium sp. 28A TaxID=2735895 RepID=UPI0015705C89|nr:hypothetical protein [Flavobacterium sp. 28A]NRT15762.1 hypothetical protein [Flavobacterium sp. 28A]